MASASQLPSCVQPPPLWLAVVRPAFLVLAALPQLLLLHSVYGRQNLSAREWSSRQDRVLTTNMIDSGHLHSNRRIADVR